MKIHFYKYQGAGNDFIMLDERDIEWNLDIQNIAHLCDRHFGIGADGLIRLQTDKLSDFRMVYYNADGRESTMCGNGGRCIVALARDLGMIENHTTFRAIDGLHRARIEGNEVNLEMQEVKDIEKGEDFYILNTGSPHFVQFVSNTDSLELVPEARKIRNSIRFQEEGINVNFVEIIEENKIRLRTYERGVEDETLACGTGVVASCLSYAKRLGLSHIKMKVQAVGGNLEVEAHYEASTKTYKNIWLKGPAKQVFQGHIEL